MDLVKKIQDKKIKCIFISPHYDDALLSCWSLISQLSGKTDITIINVFTQSNKGPYTFSAKKHLKDAGHKDATVLSEEREKEDSKAFRTFSVNRINLGLEEAIFRRKKQSFLGKFLPELDHLYPVYRFHVEKNIVPADYALAQLNEKLKSFVDTKTLVFAPYAIGNHVDHQTVRKVSEKLFSNVILYSDFPYNARLHVYGKALKKGATYKLLPDLDEKTKVLKKYKTQFLGLFPSGKIPTHEEIYFSIKNRLF